MILLCELALTFNYDTVSDYGILSKLGYSETHDIEETTAYIL
jgi:hypothetical protein